MPVAQEPSQVCEAISLVPEVAVPEGGTRPCRSEGASRVSDGPRVEQDAVQGFG